MEPELRIDPQRQPLSLTKLLMIERLKFNVSQREIGGRGNVEVVRVRCGAGGACRGADRPGVSGGVVLTRPSR